MAIAYDYNLLLPSQSQMMVTLEKHFEQFRVSSGLNTEADERKVGTLLYYLGEEAED